MNRISFLESICATVFLKSIYATFETHYEIIRGPSHAPETTCEHSTEPVCLQSSASTDSQSHATTPWYAHELMGLPSPESADLHLHTLTSLHPHALTSLHPHATTPLYSHETCLKDIFKILKNFLDASVILFNHCPLLHIFHRIELTGRMSLTTVKELLLSYIASNFHDCDDIRDQIVEIFVQNLYDFSTTPSEHTFKALVFSMEPLDVIHSISHVHKLMYCSLSLVNGRLYLNYGIHKPPSVPCITLRERLYPGITPMFVIIE